MSLPTRISQLQLVGKQEKITSLFSLKDKNCTHLVRFMMDSVNNVEKIMLVKRKESVLHLGENMITPLINLNQLDIEIIMPNTNLNGVCYVTPQ